MQQELDKHWVRLRQLAILQVFGASLGRDEPCDVSGKDCLLLAPGGRRWQVLQLLDQLLQLDLAASASCALIRGI